MTWNVTLLAMHVLACCACIELAFQAPCWIQKVIMWLFTLAMFIIASAYAYQVANGWHYWLVTRIALEVEHAAVLLYVFRLTFQRYSIWATSSDSSHSSLR